MSGRALILDCDGVLADTELDGHLVAFNRTFSELGFPFRWSVEEYGELLRIGGGKERMKAYLSQHPEVDLGSGAELEERILAAHRRKSEHYVALVESGALPPRPGVARIIGAALDAGWQVACASTSAERSVEAVLAAVIGPEQRARMAGVFAGDIVSAKKPAPDIYLLAVRALARARSEVVVIEDSQSGAAAAHAADIAHVVTVSHFTADDSFPGALSVIDSLGEEDTLTQHIAGLDIRNTLGYVGLEGLEQALDAHNGR